MYILGISCYYHDGAAALIKDGQILAAAEEERFSRIKHDSSFPKQAIAFCLNFAEIAAQDLDYVIFYEKPFTKFERITLSALATVPVARGLFTDAYKTWLKNKLWVKATIASTLKIPAKKIFFGGHHLSHAASSYYTSDFKSAAILTCDGVGEWTTTALGKGQGNKLVLNREIKFPHSLGLFYSTFTQYLGFEINEGEYKVMGLAPYGQPKYVAEVEKLIRQAEDGSFRLNIDYFNFHVSEKKSFTDKFVKLFKLPPVNPKDGDQVFIKYADIAASAQKVLEEKLLVIAKALQQETGEENLCYGGGVALNGVANWRIFKEAGFKNIFIHPAAGDSGGAVGAALYLYYHILGKPRKKSFQDVFLGQQNSESSVKQFLRVNNLTAKRLSDQDLNNQVTELLAAGKVIGWVKGRFEWGPRALGARSILADPRSKKMRDLVNKKIKFREAFRPFAPVSLYEKGSQYFEIGSAIPPILEYMLAVVPVKKSWQAKLGAVTHVDGTARPQLIKKPINPAYYNLVKSFGEQTGISTLLNTSFNLKGEPIVNTNEEAYNTFMNSELDVLILENYLIKK
ncbi:MAG: carbamoyltransferase [Candidatus Daviesbacteria bacterium]|nr:MAG: carbamoyltransferase [Candidatus Daviesbacteria bacterium]